MLQVIFWTLIFAIPFRVFSLQLPEPVFCMVPVFAWAVIRPSILAPFAILLLEQSRLMGLEPAVQALKGWTHFELGRYLLWFLLPQTVTAALLAVLPVGAAEAPARAASWGALAYLGVFSMWLGFFAWYRALVIGGMVRMKRTSVSRKS